MRFLVDESTGPAVARWLKEQGHHVYSVYEMNRGEDDEAIIRKAFAENWILITNDRDFGEMVFRKKHPHHGVILLRLEDERVPNKIAVMRRILDAYSNRLANQFVVVTEETVRFASGR